MKGPRSERFRSAAFSLRNCGDAAFLAWRVQPDRTRAVSAWSTEASCWSPLRPRWPGRPVRRCGPRDSALIRTSAVAYSPHESMDAPWRMKLQKRRPGPSAGLPDFLAACGFTILTFVVAFLVML